MSDEQIIEAGQLWRAVTYTAPDVEHLLYTVNAISNGIVMLRNNDTGAEYQIDRQMVPIYLDRVVITHPFVAWDGEPGSDPSCDECGFPPEAHAGRESSVVRAEDTNA